MSKWCIKCEDWFSSKNDLLSIEKFDLCTYCKSQKKSTKNYKNNLSIKKISKKCTHPIFVHSGNKKFIYNCQYCPKK